MRQGVYDIGPVVYYWSSATGGTEAVAQRLQTPCVRIHPDTMADQPYVLMCPSYDAPRTKGFTPKPVKQFLKDNHAQLVGVIGTGNLNFGDNYCKAAYNISARFHVPIIHLVDIRGTQGDIDDIDHKLRVDWQSFIEFKEKQ